MASSFHRYSGHYLEHSIDMVFLVESKLRVVLLVFHNYLDMLSLVVVDIQQSPVEAEVPVEVVEGTLPLVAVAVEVAGVDMGSRTRRTLCMGPSLLLVG